MKTAAFACTIITAFILTGCQAEDGTSDTGKTLLVIGSIALFLYLGKYESDRKQKKMLETEKSQSDFKSDLSKSLTEAGITSSNITIFPSGGALAISDTLDCIALFDYAGRLNLLPADKIVSVECCPSYSESITTKTKAPVISWNTTGNTKGAIAKTFCYADLKMFTNDIKEPLLKFRFAHLDTAEKYTALINLVIRNRTVL